MADMNQLLVQDQKRMTSVLEMARSYIDRHELTDLSCVKNKVLAAPDVAAASIRILRLTKIVHDAGDAQSKLLSLYHTLHNICDLCFLLICGKGAETEVYMGIRSEKEAALAEQSLISNLRGNFPGTEYETFRSDECSRVMARLEKDNGYTNNSVAVVSQVPSRRTGEGEWMVDVQGIERFIDAMREKQYVAMIVAKPLSDADALNRRNNLENLYSALSALERLTYQYSENVSVSEQHSITMSITESITNSISDGYSYSTMQNSGVNHGSSPNVHVQFNSMGLGYGLQNGNFSSVGVQQGVQSQYGQAVQQGTQRGNGITQGQTLGQTKGLNITQINKTVSDLLCRIDEQIHRIRECETYGLWESCAYFSSPAADVALMAANTYKALVCGTNSGSERAYLNIWDDTRRPDLDRILRSLRNGVMPVFKRAGGEMCNAGSLVSGCELPQLMGFPTRSVCGLTVMRMASFGREVHTVSNMGTGKRGIRIGKIYHMGKAEETPVRLDVDSFCSHVLGTGIPGVGKTTLVEMILSALHDMGVKLMVVEPVKGEYKDLLGGIPGIQIFTTNPRKNRMLRINPFEFNPGVHVLTHIDRLIEVFSVCWPLYAAQPALLRECVEEAYVRTGWDLSNSCYIRRGRVKYPDFRLLLQIVPEIIEKSKFVGETKGTYEGALLTRISMLTNGIFGQVFNSSASLKDEELFENDTIIDLSEVGSSETIALLMGILVVRLREYRSGTSKPLNQPLHHMMVLEEAHNIFRRGNSHNSEGGENISGKSVQMLSQCIAEMRGYGQGIFIVDQSPSEIDLSGIRNTATKIVMRQSESADQNAMAESLSLTPEQTAELSRLPARVAVVYQTGWTEPVLVEVNESKGRYRIENKDTEKYESIQKVRGFFTGILLQMEQKGKYDLSVLQKACERIRGFSASKKLDYLRLFEAYDQEYACCRHKFTNPRVRLEFFSSLLTELLACDDLFRLCPFPNPRKNAVKPYINDPVFRRDCDDWHAEALDLLDYYCAGLAVQEKDTLLRLLLLNDARNARQITVHNTLYGVVQV